MKTKMQLFIGITIGLVIGFGAGLHTARPRNTGRPAQVVALQQPTKAPELQTAHTELNDLLARYTDEHPIVKRQRERIRGMEERQQSK